MSMPTTNVRNQTPPCQSPLMSMSTTSVRNQTPPLSITFHVNVHYQCQKSDTIPSQSPFMSTTSVTNQTPFCQSSFMSMSTSSVRKQTSSPLNQLSSQCPDCQFLSCQPLCVPLSFSINSARYPCCVPTVPFCLRSVSHDLMCCRVVRDHD